MARSAAHSALDVAALAASLPSGFQHLERDLKLAAREAAAKEEGAEDSGESEALRPLHVSLGAIAVLLAARAGLERKYLPRVDDAAQAEIEARKPEEEGDLKERVAASWAVAAGRYAPQLEGDERYTEFVSELGAAARARRDELRDALVRGVSTNFTNANQSLSDGGVNVLADFDWRVSLTTASDKSSAVREPLCMLNLSFLAGAKQSSAQSNNNSKMRKLRVAAAPRESGHDEDVDDGLLGAGQLNRNNVLVEMDRAELDRVIAAMEAANEKVLDLRL